MKKGRIEISFDDATERQKGKVALARIQAVNGLRYGVDAADRPTLSLMGSLVLYDLVCDALLDADVLCRLRFTPGSRPS